METLAEGGGQGLSGVAICAEAEPSLCRAVPEGPGKARGARRGRGEDPAGGDRAAAASPGPSGPAGGRSPPFRGKARRRARAVGASGPDRRLGRLMPPRRQHSPWRPGSAACRYGNRRTPRVGAVPSGPRAVAGLGGVGLSRRAGRCGPRPGDGRRPGLIGQEHARGADSPSRRRAEPIPGRRSVCRPSAPAGGAEAAAAGGGSSAGAGCGRAEAGRARPTDG